MTGNAPLPGGAAPSRSQHAVLRPDDLRHSLDPSRPYAHLRETEPDGTGGETPFDTLFLTGAECPFRCVMCDLWRNTLPGPTPPGAIPRQIAWAQAQLGSGARAVKLYNSGNFFDRRAVPPADLPAIAALCRGYGRVVVENHPRLTDERILAFRDLLAPQTRLEVAMGIETVHPTALQRLGKAMDLDDLSRAARFCTREGMDLRGFLLLHAPPLGIPELCDPDEARAWTLRGVELAGELGFRTLSLVPLRPEQAARARWDDSPVESPWQWAGAAPTPNECERTLRDALGRERRPPVLLLDLWDLEVPRGQAERLRLMNRLQRPVPAPVPEPVPAPVPDSTRP